MEHTIPFRCEECNAGASSYKTWLNHLTTERHQTSLQQNQDLVEIDLTSAKNRDKAVLVNRVGCSTPLFDVASYFSNWGTLRNIIYRGAEEEYGYQEGQAPTFHCVLVYDDEEAVLEATSKMEHTINGSLVYVQKMYNSNVGSVYLEPVHISYEVGPPQVQQLPESVVNVDLREFETKKKNVFENANEYKKIAIQIKEDLSDLKIEEQVDSFCQLLCLTQDQLEKRERMRTELLNILGDVFPSCLIHPFGLDYIGVSSDIDTTNIVVDPFGKLTYDYGSIHTIVDAGETSMATQVFEILKQEQYKLQFCRDVEINWVPWVFGDSKIQKISFVHRDSGVLCNLVIESFMIVQESRLLKFLSSLDPRINSLFCFARLFDSVYKILQSPNECFKNQIMIWLMVYFLASKKIIPTMHELHSLSTAPFIMDNTDVSFCSDKTIIKHKKTPFMDDATIRSFSTLSLLKEFLNLMSTADLKQNVVCPVIGKLVPVTAFGRKIGDNFPHEMRKRYLFNDDGTPKEKRFFSGSPMGLQDPLDLTINLTKNVSFVEVTRLQDLCSRAAMMLEEILESGSGNLMEIFTDLVEVEHQKIAVGEKIFIPMESQSSESEDESVQELPMEVQEEEPKEDSSYELDQEDDNEDDEYSNQEIKKSRIRMSQSLRQFFEKAVNEVMTGEEEKLTPLELRRKFQVLWLQYLIEFNSRFWSECFGFTVEASPYQKISPDEYSQTGELLASLSLKEIFELIKTDEQGYGMDFRCELVESLSDMLYKKKVWKKKYLLTQMRPLWLLLTGKATAKTKDSNNTISIAKKMVKIPYDKRMEFSCKLEVTFDMRDEIPADGALGTAAKLGIIDETYARGKKNRAGKLRFLVAVYEKLAMKYINLRVKQWLAYCCKELEYPRFDSDFKKMKKKQKGHPKWKKFRRKWKLLGRC